MREWFTALGQRRDAATVSLVLLLVAIGANVAKAEAEALPEGAKLVAVEALPTSIELTGPFAYRQLLLTGVLESGDRVDVTRMAEVAGSTDLVSISETRLIRPLKNGVGELRFSVAGHSVAVPVQAADVETDPSVSFVHDVMPALSKLGCNQGTCHGAADGKAGFKLSLRGYDPLYDHRSLTDDLAGRRFNPAAPSQSLMLLKPAGVVPHVGGVLTKPGEPYYELLSAWIAGGAKLDTGRPTIVGIEVQPTKPIIPRAGMKQQMAVLAMYSDGRVRDVSAEAFVESGNIEVLEADKNGVLTSLRRGESPVLVRYEGNYAATTITVMGDRSEFVWNDPPTNNYIDELVYDKLERVRTLPSDLCTDADFLRRVHLDLTGLPPTVEALQAFLDDPRDTRVKRDEVIDRLVGNPDCVEHWTNKWGDLLQVNNKFLGEEGAWAMRNWIRQAVATNMPYDQFVHQVLTASGSNLQNPPASYYKILREPDVVMENTTQLFLGVRFSCNKCHDHPFERWTQNQHWQLAAYFADIGRKDHPQYADRRIGGTDVEGAKALVEVIFDQGGGAVKHPNTGQNMPALVPYQSDLLPADGSLRERFASWATSPQNEYFAKSYVNRVWSYMTGVGFIEPIDDIRAGNPPTNPELLDRLTADFIASGFDVQQLIKLICKSRVYQHSVVTNEWNEDDTINYSHAIARRLPAEVLYDTVYQVTGTPRRLPGMPINARAAEQRDSGVNLPDGFLDLFGRPPRESACECERAGGVMLGQTLNLVNGPTIAEAIDAGGNGIESLVASETDDQRLVNELFLRILNRPATTSEIEAGVASLQGFEEDKVKLAAELAAYEQQIPAKLAEWEQNASGPVTWAPLAMQSASSAAGATFTAQDDGSIFVEGPTAKDKYSIVTTTDLAGITGIKLEALKDARLPVEGPGRSPNGNVVVSELTVTAAPAVDPTKAAPVAFRGAQATFSQQGWDVAGAIDGNPATGWALMPADGSAVQAQTAIFAASTPSGAEGGTVLTVTIDHQYPDGQHNLGRFRMSVTTAKDPLRPESLPADIAAIVAVPAAQRDAAQAARLLEYYRSQDAELLRLQQAVALHENQRPRARLMGAQDLVWALINSPAFLFNR